MTQSIFIDNEGNHRRVTDGTIAPSPGMGILDSEKADHYRVGEDGTYQVLTEHGWENLLRSRRRADGTYQIPITYQGEGNSHAEEPKPRRSMTEAQGERIIELLEQLVTSGTPGSPQFNEALDKSISSDFNLKSGLGAQDAKG